MKRGWKRNPDSCLIKHSLHALSTKEPPPLSSGFDNTAFDNEEDVDMDDEDEDDDDLKLNISMKKPVTRPSDVALEQGYLKKNIGK